MIWKRDPNVEAAEKLPDWNRFHRCCGEQRLFFDRIEKRGRGYECVAFTTEPTRCGGVAGVHLATGKGATVLEALADAYGQSGREIPEAETLLLRGLNGDPEEMDSPPEEIEMMPVPEIDDFSTLIDAVHAQIAEVTGIDDFESLL